VLPAEGSTGPGYDHPMRVLLMRTCLADAVAPGVARAARRVLERAGVDVAVPGGQTCCGQPAWSAGHPDQARPVARRALRAFAGDDPVVVPSGSCAAMVRHAYPELFAGRPEEAAARAMAERTVELSQLIAREGLRVGPAGGAGGRSVTYHDSCHMLRILGERESARAALAQVAGLELRELDGTDVCCGFGGTFSVGFPELSGRLGEEKARSAAATGADELVACDLSCLLHIAGRARRTGVPLRVRHLAEVLAG
jgi:L-lactate dehydrogenase complex protein LldE